MFGYITVNRPELKIKDDALYRSFYCGLCRSLKKRYGLAGQGTLSYDMTFVGLLLSALYEPVTEEDVTLCLIHPLERHPIVKNDYIDYVADMNLLLAYYNLLDDWQDDKKLSAKLGADLLKSGMKKVEQRYPRQVKAVTDYIAAVAAIEKAGWPDLDGPAGATGTMFGELLVKEEDVWSETLRRLGFFLGKFIYLMDAYEDLEKDLKKGSYNPWSSSGLTRAEVADKAQEALTLMAGEATLAFERLPIVTYEDILRNILYAGIWVKFDEISLRDKAERKEESVK